MTSYQAKLRALATRLRKLKGDRKRYIGGKWLRAIIDRAEKAAASGVLSAMCEDAHDAMDHLGYYRPSDEDLTLIALLVERCDALAEEVERLRTYAEEQCCECFDEWGTPKPHRCHRCRALHVGDKQLGEPNG